MGNTHCYGAEKGVREQAKESIASIKDAQKYIYIILKSMVVVFKTPGTPE